LKEKQEKEKSHLTKGTNQGEKIMFMNHYYKEQHEKTEQEISDTPINEKTTRI
jgi:hypothetical protein